MTSYRYCLITDAPPLRRGGHGCHILSWNWLTAMRDSVNLIVTRRLNAALSKRTIKNDPSIPVLLYPDLCRMPFLWRLPTLKTAIEMLFFIAALPGILRMIKKTGCNRIFAMFGSNAHFIFYVKILAAFSHLPFDVYLVDDLEESAKMTQWHDATVYARKHEPRLLSKAARVFTISPGYCDHLLGKYNINSKWMPVPIPNTVLQYREYKLRIPDVRTLAFLGGINSLYDTALKDLLDFIKEWNMREKDYKLHLELLTYDTPEHAEALIGCSPNMTVTSRPTPEQFLTKLHSCWAVLLPYSFTSSTKVLVSTSFPTKFISALESGRPVLVYGPSYSSLSRHFKENQMPLCCNNTSEMDTIIRDISRYDSPALTAKYQEVLNQLHSEAATRGIIIESATKEHATSCQNSIQYQ